MGVPHSQYSIQAIGVKLAGELNMSVKSSPWRTIAVHAGVLFPTCTVFTASSASANAA